MTVGERVFGCLQGIATGDAIGKQTEMLSQAEVLRWYPNGVRGFEGPAGSPVPRYANSSKYRWRIGETTDDTERTLAVARAIIADNGSVSHLTVGRELLACTKCVHPGVRSLWEFHQASDPARIAVEHDGCGAAIRVAPVGIVHKSDRIEAIVVAAREASIPTHGGSIAIAAAAATAAAVSAAIDGAAPDEMLEHVQRAAVEAERRWPGDPSHLLSKAIRDIHFELSGIESLTPADVAARIFPDRPMTIVPLALALATTPRSAQEAILIAANVGGDSDSVASIAGGILGARYPATINVGWYQTVERLNGHGLALIAQRLVDLRR